MALAATNGDHRRGKAALFLLFCGWLGAFPHWIESSRNLYPALILAVVLGGYGLQVVLSDKDKSFEKRYFLQSQEADFSKFPNVDVLVAARDEENVVQRLIERLVNIKYPKEKISFWIIDDGSQDKTADLLSELIKKHTNFHLLRRSRSAGGGKSGALNYAFRKAKGDWLFILDADAQVQEDVLLRLVLFADQVGWSAIQLRKAVVNGKKNFLTTFQAMEMAMDAAIQRGRLLCGGVVELRGNGQFIQRASLEKCGGFNEDTVTDDLDLSFRLLLTGASIGVLWNPPVYEEAVESLTGLFKQRQRWAEGGLQRFGDYWHLFCSEKIGLRKLQDLICFFLLQYAIPVVSLVDLITSLLTRTYPVYWPLSFVALTISGLAFWKGCTRESEGPCLPFPKPFRLLLAMFYLLHWFLVIPVVTLKMAVFPKKLIWAKTVHQGN